MKKLISSAIATGFLGFAFLAGPAHAQTAVEGCAGSNCPATEENQGGQLGTGEERPIRDEVQAVNLGNRAESPEGELPFTGGDVAGMVVIGAAAVGVGAVMVRRSRKPAEATA